MAREFPSTLEMLQDLVEQPSNIRTPRGRAGYREILNYIRDLARRWGLGDVTIHEFEDGRYRSKGEPKPANLTLDVGTGEELGIFYAHGDGIHADDLYPEGINPYHLRQSVNDATGDTYEASASVDMKVGLAAQLQALHGIVPILKKYNRRIRLLVVYGEEEDSSGIHAARPLFRHADWASSTEISVNSKLGNNGYLLHARPGRVQYDLQIDALQGGHMGKAATINQSDTLNYRIFKGILALNVLQLPHPQAQGDGNVPTSLCHVNSIQTLDPASYSMATRADLSVEVMYSNPKLELVEIEALIRREMERVLGTHFTLDINKKRRTPWIKPWYEDPNSTFVQAGIEAAKQALGTQPKLAWGNPVAEEGVFCDEGVPIVTFPPDGDGEHTNKERVSLRYANEHMIPFLRNMAGMNRDLRKKR